MEARALRQIAAGTLMVALLLPGLAAADGIPDPLPQAGFSAVGAVGSNSLASANLGVAFGQFAAQQANVAAVAMVAAAGDGSILLPFSHVDAVSVAAGQAGVAAVNHAGASGTAVFDAQGDQVQGTLDFGQLVARTAQHKLGFDLDVPPSTNSLILTSAGCVRDIQAALDAASPGDDIAVCAGTYQGPFTVRQHFVTLRSQQGAAATTLEGSAGALVIHGSGVTIKGFTLQGATGAAVLVDGDGHGIAGTVLQDNLVRRNGVGVQVLEAAATVLVHNTIRDNRVGVLVQSGALDQIAFGAVVAGNTLLNNARYAVQSQGDVPTLAAFNYYGGGAPSLDVAGTCVSATAGPCRNALSQGVVAAGFSPVPL